MIIIDMLIAIAAMVSIYFSYLSRNEHVNLVYYSAFIAIILFVVRIFL